MSNDTSFVSFLRNKCQSSFYNIDFGHFLRVVSCERKQGLLHELLQPLQTKTGRTRVRKG